MISPTFHLSLYCVSFLSFLKLILCMYDFYIHLCFTLFIWVYISSCFSYLFPFLFFSCFIYSPCWFFTFSLSFPSQFIIIIILVHSCYGNINVISLVIIIVILFIALYLVHSEELSQPLFSSHMGILYHNSNKMCLRQCKFFFYEYYFCGYHVLFLLLLLLLIIVLVICYYLYQYYYCLKVFFF